MPSNAAVLLIKRPSMVVLCSSLWRVLPPLPTPLHCCLPSSHYFLCNLQSPVLCSSLWRWMISKLNASFFFLCYERQANDARQLCFCLKDTQGILNYLSAILLFEVADEASNGHLFGLWKAHSILSSSNNAESLQLNLTRTANIPSYSDTMRIVIRPNFILILGWNMSFQELWE